MDAEADLVLSLSSNSTSKRSAEPSGFDIAPAIIPSSATHGLPPAYNETGLVKRGRDLGGCAEIDAVFSINAGAKGAFFDLFNDQTKVPIFNKKFDLLRVCFCSFYQLTSELMYFRYRNALEVPQRNALLSPKSHIYNHDISIGHR
jgi:hypothetical protein